MTWVLLQSMFGMCAARPALPQLVADRCSLGESMTKTNHEIAAKKTAQSSLAKQICEIVSKNGPNARSEVLAKARELYTTQTELALLYRYSSQMHNVIREMKAMQTQQTRDSTTLARLVAAITPPAAIASDFREFSTGLLQAGLIDEIRPKEPIADAVQVDEAWLGQLIADIVTHKAQVGASLPIVFEDDDRPTAQNMERRS